MSQRQWPRRPKNDTQMLGLSETGLIWLCYILHGLSLICGGLTSLPAIIINYIQKSDAEKGLKSPLTLSHMRWQIATFWLTLGLAVACGLISGLLLLSIVGAILIYPLWLGFVVWYVYRLLKGALALNDGREL